MSWILSTMISFGTHHGRVSSQPSDLLSIVGRVSCSWSTPKSLLHPNFRVWSEGLKFRLHTSAECVVVGLCGFVGLCGVDYGSVGSTRMSCPSVRTGSIGTDRSPVRFWRNCKVDIGWRIRERKTTTNRLSERVSARVVWQTSPEQKETLPEPTKKRGLGTVEPLSHVDVKDARGVWKILNDPIQETEVDESGGSQ